MEVHTLSSSQFCAPHQGFWLTFLVSCCRQISQFTQTVLFCQEVSSEPSGERILVPFALLNFVLWWQVRECFYLAFPQEKSMCKRVSRLLTCCTQGDRVRWLHWRYLLHCDGICFVVVNALAALWCLLWLRSDDRTSYNMVRERQSVRRRWGKVACLQKRLRGICVAAAPSEAQRTGCDGNRAAPIEQSDSSWRSESELGQSCAHLLAAIPGTTSNHLLTSAIHLLSNHTFIQHQQDRVQQWESETVIQCVTVTLQ